VQLDLGTADQAAFERWRGQSPAHALAFARAYARWEQLGGNEAPQAEQHVGPSASRRALMRTAVVAAVIGLGGGGLLTSRAYAWDHAETGVGETRKLMLPDGSVLALNTDSAVAWQFNDRQRVVRLERGEVALDVSPGPGVLSLESDGLRTALSAGRFNARLKAGALDVMVLRGKASSKAQAPLSADAPIVADAYQTLLLTTGEPSVRTVSKQQVAATLAWQDGEILFQDEPLSVALEEYNRYLQGKIVIVDSSLGGIRVGGRFTSTDPSAFLEALEATLDIDARPVNGNYVLTRKK
jgi:transmembrane sensor